MAYLNELAYGQLGDDGVTRAWTRSDGGDTHLYYPTDVEVLMESPELPPPIWEDAAGFTSEEELTETCARREGRQRVYAVSNQ